MVDDHSKIDGELERLASGKGVALPIQMDTTSKREYDQLEKLSGGAFDRQYMKAMVSDHGNDIKAFRREETSARDADVRGFARKTLPALEEHLKLAKTDQVAVESETRSRGKS